MLCGVPRRFWGGHTALHKRPMNPASPDNFASFGGSYNVEKGDCLSNMDCRKKFRQGEGNEKRIRIPSTSSLTVRIRLGFLWW